MAISFIVCLKDLEISGKCQFFTTILRMLYLLTYKINILINNNSNIFNIYLYEI